MDIFKWRESYDTGVSVLDEQHKKLIELINKLYRVMRDRESEAVIKDVLEEMSKYAEYHFAEEEKLLKDNNYPGYENHIALHQSYREKVKSLMDGAGMEEDKQMKATYIFLRQWWMEHIVGEDKKYGEFIVSATAD
ncbi:bacteriohemerythrin [Desulforhopalus sp. 52FAK]